MGLAELTFYALGPLTLGMAWPAFLVFAAGQIVFVFYVKRHGPPAFFWTVAVVIAAVTALVGLGIASERAWAQLIAREGLQSLASSPWQRLFDSVRWTTGPTLWMFGLCQVVLVARPRSHLLVATLAAVSGDLVGPTAATRNPVARSSSTTRHVGHCGVGAGVCCIGRHVGKHDSPWIVFPC
jgi:hypothetical protein